MVKFREHSKFKGIYLLPSDEGNRIFTKNLDKGKTIYNERIIYENGVEYREWNPYRSKLGALINKQIRNIYINSKSRILYLGASSGTTVSHLSDMVKEGIIFAIEFAPRSLRELIQNCENRKNVIPIMGDANKPEEYAKLIYGNVDVIYQDVAQPNQTEIAIINSKYFLKEGGILILAIKARSIDTVAKPAEIFSKQLEKLENSNFEILEQKNLKPYTADHLVVIARYLGQ